MFLILMVDVMLFGVYICIVININGFVMVKGYILLSNIFYFNINRIYWFGGGGCEFVYIFLLLFNILKDYEKIDILIIYIYLLILIKKFLKIIILLIVFNFRNLMMKNDKKIYD